jgi:hypothetical protein
MLMFVRELMCDGRKVVCKFAQRTGVGVYELKMMIWKRVTGAEQQDSGVNE